MCCWYNLFSDNENLCEAVVPSALGWKPKDWWLYNFWLYNTFKQHKHEQHGKYHQWDAISTFMWYQWYHIHKILIAGLGLTPTLSTTALSHQAASREAHIGGSFYGWNGGIEGHETRQVGSTQAQAWKPNRRGMHLSAPWKYCWWKKSCTSW